MRLLRRNPPGRAFAGPPPHLSSLIWNNQTAPAQAGWATRPIRSRSAVAQALWARRASEGLARVNSSECNAAHGACATALREPSCRRDSAFRFLTRERPLPAKRTLIHTGTRALSMAEWAAWPTGRSLPQRRRRARVDLFRGSLVPASDPFGTGCSLDPGEAVIGSVARPSAPMCCC
jgi:hypothetical protein